MRKRGLYGQTVTVYHPVPMKKRVDRYVLRDVFCQIGSREVPDAAGAKSGAAMLLVVPENNNVRAARIGFAHVDSSLREAARVDGAGEVRLFVHIMIPVARRAILAGLVLAWARALGEFGATIFFAGNREGVTQTMPLAIFIGFESNMALAVGLSFVLLVASVAVLLFAWLLGDRVEL